MMLSTKSICGLIAVVLVSLVILPTFVLFASEKSAVLFLVRNASQWLYQGPSASSDLYDWGNCTYWVALLRQKAGDPVPNTWGNASTWASRAALDGYIVDDTPSTGSIMQIASVDNGLGHVAYVTSVNTAQNTWSISEMNVYGLDVVDTKTMPLSAAANFQFIHDKDH